jgi:hypothetical protein
MLTIEQSVHGLPCVQLHKADERTQRIVRSAIGRNHMDDPVYHLRRESCAFLQGDDPHSGWMLVEFWTRDMEKIRPFVDYLNGTIYGVPLDTDGEER